MNYIGASLMIFDLDSHINPKLYKKDIFSILDNKKDQRKKQVSFLGRPKTILANIQLPPIK